MAASVRLDTLRDGVRDRGEFRGDATKGPHTDGQIDADVNRSVGQWHAELVEVAPAAVPISSESLAVSAGTDSYALAADYYKTDALLVTDANSASGFRLLDRIEWRERHLHGGTQSDPKGSHYAVRGSTAYFWPQVQWTATVTHDYFACPSTLALDADTFDFVVPGVGEEWCILDVCIKRATKEEQKISEWKVLRDEAWQRLSEYARKPDRARPRRVADMRGSFDRRDAMSRGYRWRF